MCSLSSHKGRFEGRSALLAITLDLVKDAMINWVTTFLIIAIIAAVFGFSGIAGTAANIVWPLFIVGTVLALGFMVTGRRPNI